MIGVTLKGADAARRALTLLVESTRQKAVAEVKRATFSTAETARALAPTATTHMKGGISTQINADVGSIVGQVFVPAPYAPFVEGKPGSRYGRLPGRPPPIDPIRAWCLVRGIDPRRAWAIRASIAARGTPAQPFLRPAFDAEVARFESNMKRILADAAKGVQSIAGPP